MLAKIAPAGTGAARWDVRVTRPEAPATDTAPNARLRAVIGVAHHHGTELDQRDYRALAGEAVPSAAALAGWAREQGLHARTVRVNWRQMFRLSGHPGQAAPVILLLGDGGACILVGVDAARDVAWIRDPAGGEPVAVDRLRLQEAWTGEAVLIRRGRGQSEAEAPFTFGWLMGQVLRERPLLRSIGVASITLSALTIVPPLLVMQVVDRVVVHHSLSTLVLLASILGIATIYETLLGFARRELTQVVSTRVDARVQLHLFARLLALPLDYFEKTPAGETNYRLGQIWKVREFLTGKLMGTFLDMFTLVFLLPFLFWLNATLAWIVLACAVVITGVIVLFLPALRRITTELSTAESEKGTVMVETVHGIRTVKSLVMEPQQRTAWDDRVAVAGALKLRAGRIANWPQTLIAPIEMFIQRGVILIGAYLALNDSTGIAVGGLIAFMLLGGRVVQPLVGLAKMIEDFEDVRVAVGNVARVLNHPTETAAMQGGMRPRFEGAIAFEKLTFSYPGAKANALEDVSFQVAPGAMLGVVGRSGSGKSTMTRLLQGINREYTGLLKIDGVELREINLAHLRRSFGVVLQDNFLFRGTIADNLIAGRPGLTMRDVIWAARLAGAEEFIEKLPAGYATFIEEGSANLSGGQRQRLAIARALISDPRLLILDEASSALDPESEALVNANLKRIGKGRTMIIVSHRLSSLLDCDQILVMEAGKVVDIAPHRTLLERCDLYRGLWNQQNRHAEPGSRPAALSLAPLPQAQGA